MMMDWLMMEFGRMLSEQREVLGDGFMSGTIDFWTDSHRRECMGSTRVSSKV